MVRERPSILESSILCLDSFCSRCRRVYWRDLDQGMGLKRAVTWPEAELSHTLVTKSTELEICQQTLPTNESSAGERRREVIDQDWVVQSRRMWSGVASTGRLCVRLPYIKHLGPTYLILHKDSTKTVKQLKWSEDFALDQDACNECGGCPSSCADWHLIEPLLQRELAYATFQHIGHVVLSFDRVM